MFIPQTARQYGLRVDEQVDERLDPELETAAAMALLTDLHDEFGDWGLALAAYNKGARAVRKAIHSSDSRSVLRLIELGALSPYAARVMAAALLMESTQ
jgi:membrane-bound lytic murein transglycosylase D